MLDKATQLSQTDHSKYDAFVFIIMSHGGERDAVCGVDGESIGLELLMSQFTATNCRSLENKPKLFFIQACRGNRQERSSPIRSDFYRDAVRYRHRYRHQHLSDSTLPRSVSPIEADFLLFFATAPGYQAFRKERCGSPFIQVGTYVCSDNLASAYPFFFFCRRKSNYSGTPLIRPPSGHGNLVVLTGQGPFLESPGNFSGPKSNIQIKI